jgi:Cu-Zn family superoxide dismutase
MTLRRFALALLLPLAACADESAPVEGIDGADTLATLTPGAELDTAATPLSMRGVMAEVDATAELRPTEGHDVRGLVTFATVDDGILVSAEVGGLSEGLHGFHIHETGDCSAPDALSAGGHYNPADAPHGAPEAPGAERHVGDLGNLEAGADGRARYERVDSVLTLSGPTSIVGKAVIVHAGQDDFTTQPTGDAGPRLACGVIERAEG